RLLGRRAGVLAGADAGARLAAVSLVAIVALSALVVIMAADRPSLLSATTLRYLFTGAVAVMYVAYVVCFAYAPRLSARWVIAAIVAVHAIFFLAPPLALTDIFNYVNYGRMEIV